MSRYRCGECDRPTESVFAYARRRVRQWWRNAWRWEFPRYLTTGDSYAVMARYHAHMWQKMYAAAVNEMFCRFEEFAKEKLS